MKITIFPDIYATSKSEEDLHWEHLVERLLSPSEYPQKASCPLYKLSVFGEMRGPSDCLRHDENLLAIYGVEGDYDGELVPMHQAARLLATAGIKCVLYTSASHTPEKPRWRVIAPCSIHLPPQMHGTLVARINGVLGGILASESFTLSQTYYVGKVAGTDYDATEIRGQFIDLLTTLDATATYASAQAQNGVSERKDPDATLADLLNGEDVHGNALRMVGRLVAKGMDDATIRAVMTGLSYEVEKSRGAERGADLRGTELDRMIAGARKKGFAPQSAADLESLIVASDDPDALVKQIAEAGLSRVVEEALLHKLKDKFGATLGALRADLSRYKSDDSGSGDSTATRLVGLAAELCELWHDKDGNAFASFTRSGSDGVSHREHWNVNSSGYREWLSRQAHTELGTAPSSEAIKSAQNALAGMAKFDGEEHQPARRVAKDDAGYWIDLCDDKWCAILVTATGWRIVPSPTVRFVRTKAMRPLSIPLPLGTLTPLWSLCNIPEEDRPLVLAWMLECYRSDTPYPVLELIGEQGSAKSTTQETLRTFIDPNKVMLRGRPKGVEDVFVAAGCNHLISLENISGISSEFSDALCTIATGGGHASRQFYTNDEENIIEAHNPVVLNGIGAVIVRSDLLDRAIALCLPAIGERLTEEEHNTQLHLAAPGILGALLDLFVKTLSVLPSVLTPPSQRPRMADFAKLGEAMHRAMGHTAGEFLELYTHHRRDAIRRTVDSSPVAVACMKFVTAGLTYAGTVQGLLVQLVTMMPEKEREDYWPRSPRGLGDALRRVAPALRQIGIHVSVDAKPKRDGIHCELRSADISSPQPSNNGETSSQRSPTFTVPSIAPGAIQTPGRH